MRLSISGSASVGTTTAGLWCTDRRRVLTRLNAAFGVLLRKAPAYTTLRFILRGLDAAQLERVFRQHAAGLPTPVADDGTAACVAIDGKTLRGSFNAFNDRKAAHLLSAFARDGQIILGHLAIAEKSNESPLPRR